MDDSGSTHLADEDPRWMRVALGLARRRLGAVAPNPSVGAVIVRDGLVLGRGATGPGGRPHAEAVALEQASARFGSAALSDATIHVTLEPCAHHGRTPPCADALIAAGIARVVAPFEDPDDRVAGEGFRRLREAGVEVVTGCCAQAARRLNAGFLSRVEQGRPHVTLKLATTLDGRIATAGGESRWITGAAARRRVHLMRMHSDAVLVGASTARQDDPMLNVRGFGTQAHQPVRIVADGSLSLSLTSRLVCSADQVPLWLLHRAGAPAERRAAFEEIGAKLIEVPIVAAGRLSLGHALRSLADAGLTRILCEGGGQVAAALVSDGLVDEFALFQAGMAFGGDAAAAVAAFGLTSIASVPRFELAKCEELDGDVLMVWRKAAPA